MAKNPKNTDTGLRWVCDDCASTDGRAIVATIKAKYPGNCKIGNEHIKPGQQVYALDTRSRKGKGGTPSANRLRKAPPPQPSLIPVSLAEAITECELWMAGSGGLSPGAFMLVLDAARSTLPNKETTDE